MRRETKEKVEPEEDGGGSVPQPPIRRELLD